MVSFVFFVNDILVFFDKVLKFIFEINSGIVSFNGFFVWGLIISLVLMVIFFINGCVVICVIISCKLFYLGNWYCGIFIDIIGLWWLSFDNFLCVSWWISLMVGFFLVVVVIGELEVWICMFGFFWLIWFWLNCLWLLL